MERSAKTKHTPALISRESPRFHGYFPAGSSSSNDGETSRRSDELEPLAEDVEAMLFEKHVRGQPQEPLRLEPLEDQPQIRRRRHLLAQQQQKHSACSGSATTTVSREKKAVGRWSSTSLWRAMQRTRFSSVAGTSPRVDQPVLGIKRRVDAGSEVQHASVSARVWTRNAAVRAGVISRCCDLDFGVVSWGVQGC